MIQETLTKEVTLAVVGSRRWKDKALLFDVLDNWIKANGRPIMVVSGGADGADVLGEAWAKSRGIETDTIHPKWIKEGFMAGINRNADIVRPASHLIAFFLPFSGGTMNSLKRALKRHLHITIVDPTPEMEIHDGRCNCCKHCMEVPCDLKPCPNECGCYLNHCCACWARIQIGDVRVQMNQHIFTPNCFERHTNEGCMMGT
jgi:hypothetical protein